MSPNEVFTEDSNITSQLEFLQKIVTIGYDEKTLSIFVIYRYNPSISRNAVITKISSTVNDDGGQIYSQNNIKVDNTNGYEITGSFETSTTKYIYFNKNNVDYLLVFTSTDLGKMQSDINIIINSFKVT